MARPLRPRGGSINPVEQKQAPDKVGLAAHQMPGNDTRRVEHSPPTEMLAKESALGGDELVIELGERQSCRQHRVLDVIVPIVAADDPGAFSYPAFGPGI